MAASSQIATVPRPRPRPNSSTELVLSVTLLDSPPFVWGFFFDSSPPVSTLKQRRRPPLPALALCLRNPLHVFHVRSRLRQKMMQIITQADKREAFLQKLSHARRAKQKN